MPLIETTEAPPTPSLLSLDDDAIRARIERMTAHDHEPLLDPEDIDDLLELAKRPDSSGRATGDAAWTPTYDITAAVAAGWDIKAARAAAGYRFEEDNQIFYREQVHTHCMEMSKRYRRGAVAVDAFS